MRALLFHEGMCLYQLQSINDIGNEFAKISFDIHIHILFLNVDMRSAGDHTLVIPVRYFLTTYNSKFLEDYGYFENF